ncbi:MAG: glycoside hydrolase family 3 C-terminal domain-containing protein [Myxococcota bacterium]
MTLLALLACREPLSPTPPDSGVEAEIAALLADLTLEEKIDQLHGSGAPDADGFWTTPDNDRLDLRGFRMSDGPRGLTAGVASTFPVAMARGATFDPELEREVGRAIGAETAARGGDVLLAPAMNILRHPGWGRAQETYGEDVHHLGAMAVAFVEGAQEHVLASAKHYAANSIEDTRLEVDVQVSERALREVYLPHFRRVVQEGRVASVMSAYNRVNGAYCSENAPLLSILKDEWGFDGFVESDWIYGTRSTVEAANAGLDIEMPGGRYFGEPLLEAVQDGTVAEGVVDAAVTRVLRKKLGRRDLVVPGPEVVDSAEHRALARRVAEQSIVLLENDGVLPLQPGASIALIGELATVANLGDDGSSASTPSAAVSPLAGLQAAGANVTWSADASGAVGADVAVVVVGLTADDEGEAILPGVGGDRDTLGLSAEHVALVTAVAAVHDRVVVVLEGGSALTVEPWVDDVEAVLMAWYPGEEGGAALASVLLGEVAPSGRLPVSVPVSETRCSSPRTTATTTTICGRRRHPASMPRSTARTPDSSRSARPRRTSASRTGRAPARRASASRATDTPWSAGTSTPWTGATRAAGPARSRACPAPTGPT